MNVRRTPPRALALLALLAAVASAPAAEPAADSAVHGAAWLIATVADEWPAAGADHSEEPPADRFLLAQARLCAAQVLSRDGATADDWLAALDAALALPGRPPERYGETGLVGLLRWQDEKLLGVYGPWRADAREGTFLPLLRRLPDPDRWPAVRAGVAARVAAAGGATNAPPLLRALSLALARIDGDAAAEREARAAFDAIPVRPADETAAHFRTVARWTLDHPGRTSFDLEREKERAAAGAPTPEDPGDFAPDVPDDCASADTDAPARPACRPTPPRPVDAVWDAIREERFADAEREGFALLSRRDSDSWDSDPSIALLELYRRAGAPEDIVALAEGNPLWTGKDVACVRSTDTEWLPSALARALLAVSRTNDALRIARNALFERDEPPDWAFDLLREALPPAEALAAFETAAAAFPCDPRPLAAAARSMRDLGRADEAAAAARRALAMPPFLSGLDGERVLADALLALDPAAPLPDTDEADPFDPAEEALEAGRTNDAVRIYSDVFASLAAGYARTEPVDQYDSFQGWWPDERLAAAWRALPALAGAEIEPPRNLPAWTAAIRPEPLADPAARAGARFLLGRLLECSERPRAAFGQYRAALALDPRHADAAIAALFLAEDPADRADLERTLAGLGAVPADFGGFYFNTFGTRAVDAKALLSGAAAARRRRPPPEAGSVFRLGPNPPADGLIRALDAVDTPAATEFAGLVECLREAEGRRGGSPLPGDVVFSTGTWADAVGDFLLVLGR